VRRISTDRRASVDRTDQLPDGQLGSSPETGFEEMNGGCLRADIRERKEKSPEALSNFRAVVFSGSELQLRVASPIAEKQAEVVLPVVVVGLESSPIYQSLSKLGQRILNNHQSSVAH